MKHNTVPCVLFAAGLLLPLSAQADDSASLSRLSVKDRLTRIERILSSEVLLEQNQQIELIHQEIADLRELIEQENHELDLIKQRQRNLYLDMDRRINDIEAGGVAATTTGVPGPVPPPVNANQADKKLVKDQKLSEKEVYNRAFQLLKDGQYKAAIAEFRVFLKTYPDSKYSDNSQYWLGEASYVSRNYKQALQEFQKLVAAYPASQKLQGARLKIGYTYYELANWSEARNSLRTVIKDFPDTTVARKAEQRLQRIKREGH